MQDGLPCRVAPVVLDAASALCPAARAALWKRTIAHYVEAGLFNARSHNGDERVLWLHPCRVVALRDLERLVAVSGSSVMKTQDGEDAAWFGCEDPSDAETTLVAQEEGIEIRFPWQLLAWHERLLTLVRENIRGRVHPSACIEGVVQLGEGSVILPGTLIEGFVSIGDHCRIGPHAYLRGNVSIGDHSVAGHAVELKNCLLGTGTHIAHLSYAGDSIIGDDVNIGAGSILSNYRHDGAEHRMMIAGELVATGCRKLGCIIGDHARLGANTTVLPGRVLDEGRTTFPGEVVR